MSDDRFAYETCQWGGLDETKRRWYEALESTGTENVRARLAQTDAGAGGAISIGKEISVTIGFIQEWLAWHDRRKSERESNFRSTQIFWTRWAAISASIAASAGAIGWIITILRES